MPSWLFLWDEEEGGNVEHLAEHGLTPDDAEHAFDSAFRHTKSRSSGRPALYGLTGDGRTIFVVYEEIAEGLIYVYSAHEIGRK
jgi:uncharacterized DUF497 family protein